MSRRRIATVLLGLLGLAAIGLFAAGVALLSSEPGECDGVGTRRRHLREREAPWAKTHELQPAIAGPRRRLQCATSTCTDVIASREHFEAMLVDLTSTGDVSFTALISGIRSLFQFYDFGGTLGALASLLPTSQEDNDNLKLDELWSTVEDLYNSSATGVLDGSAGNATVKRTLDELVAGGLSAEANTLATKLETALRLADQSCTLVHTLMQGTLASPVTVAEGFAAVSQLIYSDDPDNALHGIGAMAQVSAITDIYTAVCTLDGCESAGDAFYDAGGYKKKVDAAYDELLVAMLPVTVALHAHVDATVPDALGSCAHDVCCTGAGYIHPPPPAIPPAWPSPACPPPPTPPPSPPVNPTPPEAPPYPPGRAPQPPPPDPPPPPPSPPPPLLPSPSPSHPPPRTSAEVRLELQHTARLAALNDSAVAALVAAAVGVDASRVSARTDAADVTAGTSAVLVEIAGAGTGAAASSSGTADDEAPSALLAAHLLWSLLSADGGADGAALVADLEADAFGGARVLGATNGVVAEAEGTCPAAAALHAAGVAVATEQCALERAAAAAAADAAAAAAACSGDGDGVCDEGLVRDVAGAPCVRCVSDAGCAALSGDNTTRCVPSHGFEPARVHDAHFGQFCDLPGVAVLQGGCAIEPRAWHASGQAGESLRRAAANCSWDLESSDSGGTPIVCRADGCVVTAGLYEISCEVVNCSIKAGWPLADVSTIVTTTVAALQGELRYTCVEEEPTDARGSLCTWQVGAGAIDAFCNTTRCAPTDAASVAAAQLQAERDDAILACAAAKEDDRESGVILAALGIAALLVTSAGLLALCCGSSNSPNAAAPSKVPKSRRGSGHDLIAGLSEWNDASGRFSVQSQERTAQCLAELMQEAVPLTAPARVVFTDLCVVRDQRRCCALGGGQAALEAAATAGGAECVVEPVSGAVLAGGVSALMGPSGSGKTSLLNAVAGVGVSGLRACGSVTVDGAPLASLPRCSVGYAAQEAVMMGTLSPLEALTFAARLGLPEGTPAEQRQALVRAVLAALGLTHVEGRMIGLREAGGAGLSGGERSRVSLALTIVTCPAVLLCDEPTSGLDAFAAHAVAFVLSKMAHVAKRTVLFSVHQPSSQVFDLLDHLTLLANGRVLYRGAASAVNDYIGASRGAVPSTPPGTSTADHLLYVCCSHRAALERLLTQSERTAEAAAAGGKGLPPQQTATGDAAAAAAVTGSERGAMPGVCTQAATLAWRCCVNIARHPTLLRVQLGTFLLMALLLGIVFADINDDTAGFQDKAGSLNFVLYFFGFGGLSMLSSVAEDWALFWREYHAGLYGAATHVSVKLCLDLLLVRVLPALTFGAIAYATVGLRRETGAFLLFELAVGLANLNAGLLCSAVGLALHHSPAAATLLAVVVMLFTLLFAGLQLNLDDLPDAVRGVPYLSWAYYAYDLLLTTELKDDLVQIEVPGNPSVSMQADVLLDLLGLGGNSAGVNVLALCGLALLWLLVNCLIVTLKLRGQRSSATVRRYGGSAGPAVAVAVASPDEVELK